MSNTTAKTVTTENVLHHFNQVQHSETRANFIDHLMRLKSKKKDNLFQNFPKPMWLAMQ